MRQADHAHELSPEAVAIIGQLNELLEVRVLALIAQRATGEIILIGPVALHDMLVRLRRAIEAMDG